MYVHAREIGGACLTEVESVGRLRVFSRGHRSAFSPVSLREENERCLYRRDCIFCANHRKLYHYRAAMMITDEVAELRILSKSEPNRFSILDLSSNTYSNI